MNMNMNMNKLSSEHQKVIEEDGDQGTLDDMASETGIVGLKYTRRGWTAATQDRAGWRKCGLWPTLRREREGISQVKYDCYRTTLCVRAVFAVADVCPSVRLSRLVHCIQTAKISSNLFLGSVASSF